MNDEEIKAIKYFYNLRATIDESYMLFDEGINVKCEKEMIKQISTILNLIEKQNHIIEGKECVIETQEHNEEVYEKMLKHKDKMIDLMANNLIGVVFSNNDNKEILFDNNEDIKQYYEKKVEESK